MKKPSPLELQIAAARAKLDLNGQLRPEDEEIVSIVAAFDGASASDHGTAAKHVREAQLRYITAFAAAQSVFHLWSSPPLFQFTAGAAAPSHYRLDNDQKIRADVEAERQRWIRALMVWWGQNGEKVKQCGKCGRFCLPRRGSLYCSTKCGNAARVSAHRARKLRHPSNDGVTDSVKGDHIQGLDLPG